MTNYIRALICFVTSTILNVIIIVNMIKCIDKAAAPGNLNIITCLP